MRDASSLGLDLCVGARVAAPCDVDDAMVTQVGVWLGRHLAPAPNRAGRAGDELRRARNLGLELRNAALQIGNFVSGCDDTLPLHQSLQCAEQIDHDQHPH